VKNKVQLITYVDRLGGGGLRELQAVLRGPLAGVFGGVHLLPFFHAIDGADAGFDPIDHTQVDPRLGTWDDVRSLGENVDVMADLIVNHVSAHSPQFEDFSARGTESPYAGMFLTVDRVFPDGASEADLAKIYRPRVELPFTRVVLKNGESRTLWTTFTSRQIDLDVRHPQGEAYLKSILAKFQAGGVRTIRLDAAGYAIKRAGTSCFMIPETYAFIGELTQYAKTHGMEVLVEVHGYYRDQIEIAKRVDRVYDFALPPLVLHALFKADTAPLKAWLAVSPRNAITVLDTHDGIGVIDAGADAATGRPGLLPPEALEELVETMHRKSGDESRQASGAVASNIDFLQVNGTYYDALGRDDRDYLIARAIQFFAPGVPQVYYVGLLAGTNDMELLAHSKVGRDINRRRYNDADIAQALAKPVVQDLLDLIRFRNTHPAFDGEFEVLTTPDHALGLEWRNGEAFTRLTVNFQTREALIVCSRHRGAMVVPLGTQSAMP
jgi:sucrose phosphorylase